MTIFHDKNLYVQTHIKGDNIEEILDYCASNNLTVVEVSKRNSSKGTLYQVWADKPNRRMRVLRKSPTEMEGWKIIKPEPTPKMYWVTYEKVSQK